MTLHCITFNTSKPFHLATMLHVWYTLMNIFFYYYRNNQFIILRFLFYLTAHLNLNVPFFIFCIFFYDHSIMLSNVNTVYNGILIKIQIFIGSVLVNAKPFELHKMKFFNSMCLSECAVIKGWGWGVKSI